MNKKLLEDLKNSFLEEKEKNDIKKNSLKALKNRRDILLNSPVVKSYIEEERNIKILERHIKNDYDILINLLNNYEELGLTSENSDLYFYLGTFKVFSDGEERQCSRVDEDNSLDKYNTYINLETKKFIHVDYPNVTEFENNNRIIISSDFPDILQFNATRTKYFMDCIKNGEEKATKKILTRKK